MRDLDHPVRRGGARLSAVAAAEDLDVNPTDDAAPVVDAHRLLVLAAPDDKALDAAVQGLEVDAAA